MSDQHSYPKDDAVYRDEADRGKTDAEMSEDGERFSREDIQKRIRTQIEQGDFTFAEDFVKAIARELDVDLEGTFLDPTTAGSTAGDVPPFSGGRPATPEHATEETRQNLEESDTARSLEDEDSDDSDNEDEDPGMTDNSTTDASQIPDGLQDNLGNTQTGNQDNDRS